MDSICTELACDDHKGQKEHASDHETLDEIEAQAQDRGNHKAGSASAKYLSLLLRGCMLSTFRAVGMKHDTHCGQLPPEGDWVSPL